MKKNEATYSGEVYLKGDQYRAKITLRTGDGRETVTESDGFESVEEANAALKSHMDRILADAKLNCGTKVVEERHWSPP